jgi:hypothetical protein
MKRNVNKRKPFDCISMEFTIKIDYKLRSAH